MKVVSRWVGLLAVAAFSTSATSARAEPLVTHFGIGSLLHPVQEPAAVALPSWCQTQPYQCCKDHVYIFGVNGFNPLCLGNFNGMLSYLRKQGYQHTYFGQLYTSHWFASEIRKIRQTDPQAKIVLIGFSLGANYTQAIACDLNREGIQIDLLVYLVGDLMRDIPENKPANVQKIVNIRAKGLVFLGGDLFFNGEDMVGASNHTLTCRHILAPSREETISIVAAELMALACVPVATAAPAVALPPVALPAGWAPKTIAPPPSAPAAPR